jgi:hypothetical protein
MGSGSGMQQRIRAGEDLALKGLSGAVINTTTTVIPVANNVIAMAAVMRSSLLTIVMATELRIARSKRPLHFTQCLTQCNKQRDTCQRPLPLALQTTAHPPA